MIGGISHRRLLPVAPDHRPAVILKSPAKINWFLQVLGKREDGYHDIKSVMQGISLYDELALDHADSIEVETDLEVPMEDNIVYKAASLLRKHTACRKGAKISLKKNIPVGAGLGGGSSNAAYTLSGLNMLWGLGLSKKELISIGGEIGSDVPFFLGGPAALVEGKGEKIEPLKITASIALLLVKPRISVSTAWAYSAYDLLGEKLTNKPFDIKLFCRALNERDFASIGFMLYNDLEDVVTSRYPVIREIKHGLLNTGAVISAMSGSGSVVFGVFCTKTEAEKAAQAMKADFCLVSETIV